MKALKPLLVLLVLMHATLLAHALPAQQKPKDAQAAVTNSTLPTVTMSNKQASKDVKEKKQSQVPANTTSDSSAKP